MAFGVDDIIGQGLAIINKFIPDPAAKAAAEAEFRTQMLASSAASDAAQGQVNAVEAGNGSLFVSGWRPMIGWVCALALAYQYIGKPLATWAFLSRGYALPPLPPLDDTLWQLMFGMLGMGTLRTVEKVRGAGR